MGNNKTDDALESVARALPFCSMLQVPAEIWLGKHRGADLAAAYGMQVAWAIALVLAGRLMMSRGERRLVVQGG